MNPKKIKIGDGEYYEYGLPPQTLEALHRDATKNTSMSVATDKEPEILSVVNGKKSINFDAWGGFEAFLNQTSGSSFGGTAKSQILRRVNPWLAKAVDMTALAVSELPFVIRKKGSSENEPDFEESGQKWKNKLGGIPSPERLMYHIASSLCFGRAYLISDVAPENNNIIDLHYCPPHTVQPIITTQGLQTFARTSEWGPQGIYWPADHEEIENLTGAMMYFWLPDADIEIGPAKTFPAGTALLSVELMTAMDSTLQAVSEAGFIPPTILSAAGNIPEPERQRQETWWNSFLRRWDKTTAKLINAEKMDIKKVGAGMEELKGIYDELRSGSIESIGTAFGIPAALFMSDMAFASEVKPLIKTWYTSSQFIRIYRCIESTFNQQLFNKFELEMIYKPETLPAFQEDEAQRAASYTSYVGAKMRPSIAAEMLGLNLPQGIEYKDLDEQYDKSLNTPPPTLPIPSNEINQAQNKPPVAKTLTAEQIKELDLWRQVAERNFKKGKGKTLDFATKSLPGEIVTGVRSKLEAAESLRDITKAFNVNLTDKVENVLDNLLSLLE